MEKDPSLQSEEEPLSFESLNTDLLKGIYEKCTAVYEGKYSGPLFEVNVFLTDEERKEISRLVEITRNGLEIFKQDPLWDKLLSLVAQLETKGLALDFVGSAPYLIDDPGATDVTKDFRLSDDGKTKLASIRVPSRIRNIYLWSKKADSAADRLRHYETGTSKGTSAKSFGEDIKQLYRFNKELFEQKAN